MEKKIATSLEVLIKVAQYESIRLTKYGEAKIEYESEEERIEKEDKLQDEVSADLIRTMRALPDKLGKKTNAVIEIEEKIQKRIPEWLEKGPEPNIADNAKKSAEKSEAEAHAKNEDRKAQAEEETNSTTTEIEELFSPDSDDEPKSEDKNEDVTPSDVDISEEKDEKSEDKNEDSDDFDDDEDLFA